ncbi:uncharacterized protein IWZ02DRAFT_511355, partial [Phyllosticta citriasiana]|uniref:uncharacterized protein n=1 Tax=Phyllosticta citriasiana TaxID=595635 RepID=UPI0030FD397D
TSSTTSSSSSSSSALSRLAKRFVHVTIALIKHPPAWPGSASSPLLDTFVPFPQPPSLRTAFPSRNTYCCQALLIQLPCYCSNRAPIYLLPIVFRPRTASLRFMLRALLSALCSACSLSLSPLAFSRLLIYPGSATWRIKSHHHLCRKADFDEQRDHGRQCGPWKLNHSNLFDHHSFDERLSALAPRHVVTRLGKKHQTPCNPVIVDESSSDECQPPIEYHLENLQLFESHDRINSGTPFIERSTSVLY